ncbi:DnaJ protein, putative [Hepatocystis sp. ex Piliocolobus tephrosceles]|nr:DnaJ protein, putative [Hepatocystis sp. ex Piliocolobus tephrosceles]
MNYYKILGVSKNACKKTIREAYLKKVKIYHPDLNKSPEATSKFKQLQEAYQALYNNDCSQKTYQSENTSSRSYYSKNTQNNQTYDQSDDFNDFHRAFYEEVRRMRENEKKEQYRRYANNTNSYTFNDFVHKYAREYFYINLIFKLFPLFVVPFLFFFVVYKHYILKAHLREKPVLLYDSYGRAYLVDMQGRKFRAAEFDKY